MKIKKEKEENKRGYPPYDDDKYYDVEQIISAHDYTGSIPTPPKTEDEAESYSDMLNIPEPKGEIDNRFQRVRPHNVKHK